MAPLLIGVDEGTTAVKAVLYDEKLTPLKEARRSASSRATPTPAGSSRTPRRSSSRWSTRSPTCSTTRRARWSAAGSTTRANPCLAWDAEPASAHARRRLAGQAPDRVAGHARRARDPRAQRPPAGPVLQRRQLAWLLRNRGRPRGRPAGNVDAWLTDRLGAGFATDASTASRTQLHRLGDHGWDPWLCETFGVRRTRCRRSATASAGSAR